MPVRRIPKSYRNVTGIYASSKSIDSAMFESTLERDFITLLEFDSHVLEFEVQPVKIEWTDQNGKHRRYFPDVIFKRKTKQQGWKFKIMTEVEVRTVLQKNAKFLQPFIRRGADREGDMNLLDNKLRELKSSTLAQLLSELVQSDWDKAALLPTLWYLVGTRQMICDLESSPLNMNTPILRFGYG
ncbi:TnsA endonuclease C-terminal domain-containing protein [Thiomicrorhabdus indica]|uniref:TnsA endonuclease C-terminal domain-containing protein n=1 Tax=Thiomicrorhabdus indica TaxID=2267253 RepID=UPI00102D6840|nr:TnsA endonuclease C-terminal domain-containing protein [Thiomicrorhabdus indica]